MENSNENKKERIIQWLTEFERLSSSRFMGLLGLNYESVKRLLEELESENKIKKEEETNAIYWVLNDGEI